ncbi:MAG: hypothetical protein F6K30_06395 [Cyanothece sp. SIO2G6]|nr:hypothetical protein [Cyanothece sp. SIO2G6]
MPVSNYLARQPMPLSADPGHNHASITPYTNVQEVGPLTDVRSQQLLTGLREQSNGVKVATARVQLKIDEEKLKQKRVELGTERLKTETVISQYYETGAKLVTQRFKTAMSVDVGIATGRRFEISQYDVRADVEAHRLSTNEKLGKNADSRQTVPLSASNWEGMLDRFGATAALN